MPLGGSFFENVKICLWTVTDRLKGQAVQVRIVRLLARSISLGELAAKAIFMGKKPTFITQLMIEE